mmetsp:Transcript_19061/g.28518  ORF Transcript_19061/g.28518 Transcript_19061/m.28518 type:complete len:129 (-) Transcript_19061:258-644(-)
MQTDPAAAFVVARRQDMIRLAVALIEVAMMCTGVESLSWVTRFSDEKIDSGSYTSVGALMTVDRGKAALLHLQDAIAANLNTLEVAKLNNVIAGEDGPGWEFLLQLSSVAEDENPLFQLNQAARAVSL